MGATANRTRQESGRGHGPLLQARSPLALRKAPHCRPGAGALKVEHPGTQSQRFDFDEFNDQFKQQFGYAL